MRRLERGEAVLVDGQDGQRLDLPGTNAGGVAAKIDEGSGGGDWMAILIVWLRKENGSRQDAFVDPRLTQVVCCM